MSTDDLYIPHVPRSGIDKMLTYVTKYIEYYSILIIITIASIHSGCEESSGQMEWKLQSVVDNTQLGSLERVVEKMRHTTYHTLPVVEQARKKAEGERDRAMTGKQEAEGERDRVMAGKQEAEEERDILRGEKQQVEEERDRAMAGKQQAEGERDRAIASGGRKGSSTGKGTAGRNESQ